MLSRIVEMVAKVQRSRAPSTSIAFSDQADAIAKARRPRGDLNCNTC
jgi:hypothetical protein